MTNVSQQNHNCEVCSMRKRAETKPKSLLGHLWHWHIKWCPGWKSYQKYLVQREAS